MYCCLLVNFASWWWAVTKTKRWHGGTFFCISQLSCWKLQCGPFCCFYPVRCLLRRSEEEAPPPPLPPPLPWGLWRRGRGLSIKRNGCLSCDGKRTGLWREEMRGGLPCLAHKEMACHPLEIKNDLAKKNKRFFSKKKILEIRG